MSDIPEKIPHFLDVRPSAEEQDWMRRGLDQPGGKLLLFDENDDPVNPRIVRRCLEQQWVEPWLTGEQKPNSVYMACRLTPLGWRLVAGSDDLTESHDVVFSSNFGAKRSSGQDRAATDRMLLQALEVMYRRERRNARVNQGWSRPAILGSLAVSVVAAGLVFWQVTRLPDPPDSISGATAPATTLSSSEGRAVIETAPPATEPVIAAASEPLEPEAVEPKTSAIAAKEEAPMPTPAREAPVAALEEPKVARNGAITQTQEAQDAPADATPEQAPPISLVPGDLQPVVSTPNFLGAAQPLASGLPALDAEPLLPQIKPTQIAAVPAESEPPAPPTPATSSPMAADRILPPLKPLAVPQESRIPKAERAGFRLQFGAFRIPGGAESLRARLAREFAALLDDIPVVLEPPDPDGSSRLHKVRSGPIASRSQAAGICARMRAAGQSCFVFRPEG